MDDSNLATAVHEIISSFLTTSCCFLRRRALLSSAVSTFLHQPLAEFDAGESTQKSRIMGNLGGHSVDPSRIFALKQKTTIQTISVAFSSVSVLACLVMLYMCWMAKKNFRRNLIFLLLLADFFKSLWYLLFASFSLSVGGIATGSSFCQANGFLLQASIEACDAAIMFMSLHMSLQIFSPTSKTFGHDGLYRFRHTVLGIYLAFPLTSASLAFVNDRHGYISQGPFCTLPIRPFWYRLALTWIPRYLILIYIVFVAIRIYLHVGNGFKVFARQEDKISTGDWAAESCDPPAAQELKIVKKDTASSSVGSSELQDNMTTRTLVADPVIPTHMDRQRRRSSINWPPAFTLAAGHDDNLSTIGSRRSSRAALPADGSLHVDFLQVPPEQKQSVGSTSTLSSIRTNGDVPAEGNRPAALAPIEEARNDHMEDGLDIMSEDTPLKKRRRAIQRQLRLLFIYPSVYMIMWAVPFVYHAANYSDYYAQHPIYGLAVVSIFCQASLGFVDCVVFGWREKPWKHIPGSDGTFFGAFMFWRFGKDGVVLQWSTPAPGQIPDGEDSQFQEETVASNQRPQLFSRSASYNSIRPMMHRKTYSGSSDRNTMQAEQAAERLALERAEREEHGPSHSRSASVNTNNRAPTEWWERKHSQAVYDTSQNGQESPDLR